MIIREKTLDLIAREEIKKTGIKLPISVWASEILVEGVWFQIDPEENFEILGRQLTAALARGILLK